MTNEWATRRTLLARALDPDDQSAWDEFVRYYKQFINVVIHQMGIQLSEFDDVVQEVLVKIWKNLKKYETRPDKASFRTWLSKVIRNSVLDYLRSKRSNNQYNKRKEIVAGEFIVSEGFISESDFDVIVQKEWEEYITTTALDNIRKNFTGHAISVFEMSMNEASIEEICEVHEIKYNTVRSLRNRVKKALIQEVVRLKEELEI